MKFAPLLAIAVLLTGCATTSPPTGTIAPPLPSTAVPKARAKALTVPADPSVTLAWDASVSSNVAGYRIYQGGQSGLYTNVLDVGYAFTATVTNIITGSTNYFAATCYTTNGLESVKSNEAVYLAAPAPPNNFRISAQVAASPYGPWLTFTNFALPNNGSNNFFRLAITAAP